MTDDEFRDKFHELLLEYDPKKKMDFLLAIVEFDETDEPEDIYMLGRGCPACITAALVLQVEDGTLKHSNKDRNRVH